MAYSPSDPPLGMGVNGVSVVDMALAFTMMVELSSETLHVLINDASSHYAVL